MHLLPPFPYTRIMQKESITVRFKPETMRRLKARSAQDFESVSVILEAAAAVRLDHLDARDIEKAQAARLKQLTASVKGY